MNLSKAEESSVLLLLSKGNELAIYWSLKILGVRRYPVFLKVLKNAGLAEKLGVSVEEMFEIGMIPLSDLEVIRCSWDQKDILWEQHHRIAYRVARMFIKRRRISSDRASDYESEAGVAFMKALTGFVEKGNGFGAYLGSCVNRELKRYHCSLLGIHPSDEKHLFSYFGRQQMLEASGERSDFVTVADSLGFGDNERDRVRAAVSGRVSESSMVEGLGSVLSARANKSVDSELIRAIGMVELSVLERDAWISRREVCDMFRGSKGSFREVAVFHGVHPEIVRKAASSANRKIRDCLRGRGF